MAEQSISVPVTPKSTDSDANNSRRCSMGKATSSRSDEKILPHYLRASTSSCHDFCKFGRKHAFEEKTRRPFPRRNANKPPDEHSYMEFQPERNRTSKVTQKQSSNPKTPPDTSEIIKQELPKKPLDRISNMLNVVMAEKKTLPGALLTKSADRQSPVLREILAKKKTTEKDVLSESVDSQFSVSSDNWAEKRKTSLREKNKAPVVNLRTLPTSKTHLSTKMIKPGVSSSSEKFEVSLKQASSKTKEENISAKGADSLKVKSSSPESSRVLIVRQNSENKIVKKALASKIALRRVQTSPRAFLSPKTSSSGITSVASSRASLSVKPNIRVQMSPRASMSFKPSLNRVASLNTRRQRGSEVVSLLKNQSKSGKANNLHPKIKNADPERPIKEVKRPSSDEVEEKTLYVIKMDTENKYLESDKKENLSAESSPPPLSSAKSPSLPEVPLSSSSNNGEDEDASEYTSSEAEDDSLSEYDEAEYMEEAGTEEGQQKGWQRKAGMMPSQEKNDQPVKLRFRRGKVIDVKPEHNSPRRLKFRQGRVLGENQNLKADARRSFRRRGAEDLTSDNKSDSEQVVLRHQDVHGRKDAQGLFNNVIEETASKLVETRKSKVKALVGAFETVISLQDSKPPVNMTS